MKGRDQWIAQQAATHDLIYALGHLGRRFVGEGDGEDRVRLNAGILDQIGNAIGDYTSLSRAGAGEDQDRTIDDLGGLSLLRIKLIEKQGLHQ